MAYVLYGEAGKGIKITYLDPYSATDSSRTYSGLNVNTNASLEGGAVNGMFIGDFADCLLSLYQNMTEISEIPKVLYITEEVMINGGG